MKRYKIIITESTGKLTEEGLNKMNLKIENNEATFESEVETEIGNLIEVAGAGIKIIGYVIGYEVI